MRQIAQRYARALFELSVEENILYPVYISLQEINTILKEKKEFSMFIDNPLLSLDVRGKIIQGMFEGKIPKLLFKFLLFINLKKRLYLLRDIFESFDELYLEKNNQIKAHLQTAYELEETQKNSIKSSLSHKYNKEINLQVQTKSELLGGFRFLALGMLFDSSIKSQLEQFRQKVHV